MANVGHRLVVGTVETDRVVGSTPDESVSVNRDDLTGQIDTTGAVSFQSPVLPSTTEFGGSTANRLVLNLPMQSGGLQAVVFRAAPPGDFNAAVAALQSSVTTADQRAQGQVSVDHDEAVLNSDLTAIGQDEQAVRQDVTGVASDVSGMATDTTSTVAAANRITTEAAHAGPGDPSTCGDADTVAGDADTVQGDADTVEGDLDTTTAALSQLRDQLQSAGADLGRVQADVPRYSGTAESPAPAAVHRAVTHGALAWSPTRSTA